MQAIRWLILPEWENRLRSEAGLDPDQWVRSGRATIVKHGPHRTVYRLDLATASLYVKHYRCAYWHAPFVNAARKSPSRREWDKALELQRRCVPTVCAIAVGETNRGGLVGDSFFITEAVPDAESLKDLVHRLDHSSPPASTPYDPRPLAVALAQLCARAHEAGVRHDDFHAGNILVQPQGSHGSRPGLYMIDVPDVHFTRPLAFKDSIRGLAVLLAELGSAVSATVKWRFLREYLDGRPSLNPVDPRSFADALAREGVRHARRVTAGRDKRVFLHNRDFRRLHFPTAMAHVVFDLPKDVLAQWLGDPGQVVRRAIHSPAKLSFGTVVVHDRTSEPPRSAALKWIRSAGWTGLFGLRARHRARRAWFFGHALRCRGINTPRPLALILPRHPLRSRGACLAVEWLENATTLHEWAWSLMAADAPHREWSVDQCALNLGRLVGRLHAWNYSHRDLKATNFLMDGQTPWLVDLDGLACPLVLTRSRRAADVARLAASLVLHPWVRRTTRMRFLRAWLEEQSLPSGHDQRKKWWRAIEQRLRSLLARSRSPDRPLA